MSSPYQPPASRFLGQEISVRELRWRGAATFASIPVLLMCVFQGLSMYIKGRYGSLQAWEPALVCVPVCVLAAGFGYAVAVICARGETLMVVTVALLVGCLWTLGSVAGFYAVYHLCNPGARGDTASQVTKVLVGASIFFVPCASLLCAWLRRHGRNK